MLIVSIVQHTPTTYGSEPRLYVYPGWANGIGWAMVGLALIFIPLLALIEYCKAHTSFSKVSTEPLSQVSTEHDYFSVQFDRHTSN
jgi:hypothetical protein